MNALGILLTLALTLTASAEERGMVELSGERGATVVLDGITLGVLPLKTALPEGVQTFEVISRTGLATFVTREVSFAEGQTPSLNLAGEGPAEEEVVTGTVNVFGPTGTKVWFDGKEAGSIPLVVELPEGSHTVKVLLPDGTEYEINKAITFDKGKPFNLMLN